MPARVFLVLLSAGMLSCASGCAADGPPATDALARAHTLVDQADKGPAQKHAAADLQRAHDELSAADAAAAAHHNDIARINAESAAADADLAVARGQAGEAQQAAREITSGNDQLRTEANRAADAPIAAPVVTPQN